MVQRRASKEPPDKGGWNVFFTFLGGPGNVSPASNIAIRASGGNAWFGWPNIPKLEGAAPVLVRRAGPRGPAEGVRGDPGGVVERPDLRPPGGYFQPTAFRKTLTDIPEGIPQFYRVKRV